MLENQQDMHESLSLSCIQLHRQSLHSLRMNFIDPVQEAQYKEAPSWFKNWETIGLIAWKDQDNDELIQYSSGNALAGSKT